MSPSQVPPAPPSSQSIVDRLRAARHNEAAKELGSYEDATTFFGTSATYVKQRVKQNGLDYCPDIVKDVPCSRLPGCDGMEHKSIGKLVELVMVALHQDLTDGSVRRVTPWDVGLLGFARVRMPPVVVPRDDGYRDVLFIDLENP